MTELLFLIVFLGIIVVAYWLGREDERQDAQERDLLRRFDVLIANLKNVRQHHR